MSVRSVLSFAALAFAVTPMASIPIAAQVTQPAAEIKKKAASKPWTAPLTPDGQPDLQGNWVNRSATPLERPKQLEGRQSLTDAEVADLKARADRLFKDGYSDMPTGDDVYLAALANLEKYKRATSTADSGIMLEREFDNRTSLIVDPPDGKLPPYTPAGQQRQRAFMAAAGKLFPPATTLDLTNFERCITWGVPMPRPGPDTSYYQIVQSPGYVVIVMEAIHDARIIPVSGPRDARPHLPPGMRTWNGDSRGRWEGQTLVVDTTNFSPKDNFMGSAENLHLVERFTRIAPDEIRYEMTVDDPTTWTKPWTAALRLKQTEEKIYEFACHEGNFEEMEGMLSTAPAEDAAAKEAAKKRPE
jgi:hypothetical protein